MQIAEMQISVKGYNIRAVTETKDLYASIDKDVDIVEGQININGIIKNTGHNLKNWDLSLTLMK